MSYLTPVKSQRGLTLIELMIVVSIIGILIGIGTISVRAVQRQGRDAQRKSDLAQVASALEQHFSDFGAYPEDDTNGKIQCGSPVDVKDWGSDPFECTNGGSKMYLSELPNDPTASQTYSYDAQAFGGGACSGSSCQTFILATDLENNNDPEREVDCVSGFDYCVSGP